MNAELSQWEDDGGAIFREPPEVRSALNGVVGAFLRDRAELLDAQFAGDPERTAAAQKRIDAWNRWAESLPDEEEE